MKMPPVPAALALLLLVGASPARAYVIVTDGHVDVVSITYSEATGLLGRVHADAGNYLPSDALIYDGPSGSTEVIRPSGSTWDFLGVGAGEQLHYWPQSAVADRVYAGFEAQSITPGAFASYMPYDLRLTAPARWLKVSLVDVRYFDPLGQAGAAGFSLWTVPGIALPPTVWMASSDGITSADAFYLTESGHAHANWGFTKPGYYQIDVRVSGILSATGVAIESPVTTFHLGVEHLPVAIPEPGALALLALAGCCALAMRHRRPFP